MNPLKLLRVLRAYRAGMPLGDVVVLKLDALGSRPRDMAARLQGVSGYAPEPELAKLRALPAGTLGREYARFLDANGIVPLAISDGLRERFREDPYALRYTVTHDLHHTLTGFDAGLAGEMGALGFNVGQGAAPVPGFFLWLACLVSSVVSPTQAATIWHNARVGLAMGKRARLVIAEPIESWFEEPLAGVRRRLSIDDPHVAGVRPSGSSVVVKLLQPRTSQHGS
jgi:ubiquinone biosynthesis protein Coq4